MVQAGGSGRNAGLAHIISGRMSDKQSIRIGGVPEHFNLPWHLALESDDELVAGTALEWADYPAGTGAMLADLVADRLDLAVLLTEGAALGLARQLPIQAVSLYTTSPLIWGVHVPASSGIQGLAELRGARFAISRYGSGSHLMTLAMALERGWPAAELEFEVVGDLPGAIAAFDSGHAGAFLWEHFTTQPVVDAGHFRRVGDFIAPWPAWVLCARESVWLARRDEIEKLFASVLREARRLIASDDAAATIASRYGLKPAAVEKWLAKTRWVRRLTSPERGLAAATEMLMQADAI
jgi:ABC-type nitrate/sulfonate/bicarbonate transport system substrate-binding protein